MKKKLKIKKNDFHKDNHSTIDILEMSLYLIRQNFLSIFPIYSISILPFVIGMIYFVNDVSRLSSDNKLLLASSAFLLTCLFCLKNYLLVWFHHKVMNILCHSDKKYSFNFFREVKVFLIQGAIQGLGFIAQIIGLLTFTFGFSSAYVYSVPIILSKNNGRKIELKMLLKRLNKISTHRFTRSFILIKCILIFAFIIIINLFSLIIIVPFLLKAFFNIETTFSLMSGDVMITNIFLNSTIWSIVLVCTYLIVDFILRVAFSLHLFYGESLIDGSDLFAEVAILKKKQHLSHIKPLLIIGFIGMIFIYPVKGHTDNINSKTPYSKTQVELKGAIKKTFNKREYIWKMPRREITASDSIISHFFRVCFVYIDNFMDWVKESFKNLLPKWEPQDNKSSNFPFLLYLSRNLVMILSVLLLIITVCVSLYYFIKKRKPKYKYKEIKNTIDTINLDDDNTTAEDAEYDEWISLANKLIENGDLKLALRALFFAGIQTLAKKNILSLAKYKSNNDYYRELQRRCHSMPIVVDAYLENMLVFDTIWYGDYPITEDLFNKFTRNNETLIK